MTTSDLCTVGGRRIFIESSAPLIIENEPIHCLKSITNIQSDYNIFPPSRSISPKWCSNCNVRFIGCLLQIKIYFVKCNYIIKMEFSMPINVQMMNDWQQCLFFWLNSMYKSQSYHHANGRQFNEIQLCLTSSSKSRYIDWQRRAGYSSLLLTLPISFSFLFHSVDNSIGIWGILLAYWSLLNILIVAWSLDLYDCVIHENSWFDYLFDQHIYSYFKWFYRNGINSMSPSEVWPVLFINVRELLMNCQITNTNNKSSNQCSNKYSSSIAVQQCWFFICLHLPVKWNTLNYAFAWTIVQQILHQRRSVCSSSVWNGLNLLLLDFLNSSKVTLEWMLIDYF